MFKITFFILIVWVALPSRADDKLNGCSDFLSKLNQEPEFIKTKTGGYAISPSGSVTFTPANSPKSQTVTQTPLLDPSHKAILERTLGKEVVEGALIAKNPLFKLAEAWEELHQRVASQKHSDLLKSFSAIAEKIDRDKPYPKYMRKMLFEILNDEGRVFDSQFGFLAQFLSEHDIKLADEIELEIRYTALEIDLGVNDWEPLTIFGYDRLNKKPIDYVHVLQSYKLQTLIGKSRVRISNMKKGVLGIIKAPGSDEITVLDQGLPLLKVVVHAWKSPKSPYF